MGRVILDTSVLIAINNAGDSHYKSATSALLEDAPWVGISVISYSEFLVGFTERVDFDEFSSRIFKKFEEIFNVDAEIAALGAQIRSQKKLKLPDSLISATAVVKKCELWTFDVSLAKSHQGSRLLV
ncbi:MAG: PIN domain-containing protein [Actinomycetes bacterium]